MIQVVYGYPGDGMKYPVHHYQCILCKRFFTSIVSHRCNDGFRKRKLKSIFVEVDRECHQLKIWPEYFSLHCQGIKTFEIRKNDRGFQVGDTLQLQEYFPDSEEYSGRFIIKPVKHIFEGGKFGLEPGYVIISTG